MNYQAVEIEALIAGAEADAALGESENNEWGQLLATRSLSKSLLAIAVMMYRQREMGG